MNRKQVIESAFNYCSTLNYDEEVVNVAQQEIDNLLESEKILDIKKVRVDDRTNVLTIGGTISIKPNLFGIKR